jgi:hypothetical protein
MLTMSLNKQLQERKTTAQEVLGRCVTIFCGLFKFYEFENLKKCWVILALKCNILYAPQEECSGSRQKMTSLFRSTNPDTLNVITAKNKTKNKG